MNAKRYFIAAVVLFIFLFLYDWFVHGVLLSSIYMQTPDVWRPMGEMMERVPFNIVMQLLIAVWLAFVFAKLFSEGGVKNGLRFGLYFGGLSALQVAESYYWLPISFSLALIWFVVNFVEAILGGMVLGAVYRR